MYVLSAGGPGGFASQFELCIEKAIATDPEVVRKLKKLSAAGLIGMEWRQ